jgi:Transglycosylase-like domain
MGHRLHVFAAWPRHASRAYKVWVRDFDKAVALRWNRRYSQWRRSHTLVGLPASWVQDALCVHSHEGAWNDPNAPYWGGLQMDLSFMESYGPEFYARYGTADHWPPADQMIAAYRAWRVRGWEPWPNTARMCGLL